MSPERISFLDIRLYVRGPVPYLDALDMNRDGLPDLVVQDDRTLAVYLQDPRLGITPTPKAQLEFPADVFVYDVGALGRDCEAGAVAMTPNGVEWFAYRNDAFSPPIPLLVFPTLFRGACAHRPLRAALLFDMEGDGDADLILPDAGGFLIFAAGESGFTLAQRLRAEPGIFVDPYGRSIQDPMQTVFTLPNFHFGDVNGDKRLDLLIEGANAFDVYYQDANGRYDAVPALTVSINAAGAKKRKSGQRFFSYEVPPKVLDLNGDGFVDAVATFPSKGVTGIFLGKAGAKVFDTPDQVIRFDGWTLAHILEDVNGDGRKDLILAKMEKVGFWGGLQILMTRTIDLDILAYLEGPDGRYPESPDYSREISVPLVLSASHSTLKIETPYLLTFAGDFNRDGRRDMAYKSGNTDLAVHFGMPDGVFTAKPQLRIPTTDTSQYSTSRPTVADLNGDGISDLVLTHHDFSGEHHLIEVLMSKVAN